MKRPPERPTLSGLGRLEKIAAMLAEAASARLAPSAARRAELRGALQRLGAHEDPLAPEPVERSNPAADPASPAQIAATQIAPALIRARIAHRAWIDARRQELNRQLALAEAEWHALRPSAVRATGRARMLGHALEARQGALRQFREARARADPDVAP